MKSGEQAHGLDWREHRQRARREAPGVAGHDGFDGGHDAGRAVLNGILKVGEAQRKGGFDYGAVNGMMSTSLANLASAANRSAAELVLRMV